MGKYYIKFRLTKHFNAGSKAMGDIMSLLESRGYKAVLSLPTGCKKWLKLLDFPLLLLTLFFRVGRRGTVVYFAPSNAQRIRVLKCLKRLIGYRLVCFINDVQFIRLESAVKNAQQELGSIAAADVVMAPNENSIRILQEEYHLSNQMVPVSVWDFLIDDTSFSQTSADDMRVVAFAGNLNKAVFLRDLQQIDLKFWIWGDGREKGKAGNCEFMGAETHERLVSLVAECAWGLVWDGDSVDTCSGLLGTYLRFNNSHKCGLYLAAGLPLIVWKESGMALFVEKHRVGICVTSLSEAADIIHSIDSRVYAEYRQNAQRIGMQVRRGDFFLRALTEVENMETVKDIIWAGK